MEQIEAFYDKLGVFVGNIPEMVKDAYEANPENFSYVVGGVLAFLVLLGIKEILDIFFHNNKGALKKRVRELEQEKNTLGEKYLKVRKEYGDLQAEKNSLADYVNHVSSIAWGQIFTKEIVSGIVNQDRKVVQLAEDNYQLKAHLLKLGVTHEEIVELENKFAPEDDDKYFDSPEEASKAVDSFLEKTGGGTMFITELEENPVTKKTGSHTID